VIRGKVIALTLFAGLVSASSCLAAEPDLLQITGMVVSVDWQAPEQLPPRFRNHCTAENFTGRPYCSDHCGSDYQFYYCTKTSFGCCRLGRGYCDWDGLLRCTP